MMTRRAIKAEFLKGKKEKKCMVSKLHELSTSLILAGSISVSIILGACSLAPKYVRPSVQVPAAYKELSSDNSKKQMVGR